MIFLYGHSSSHNTGHNPGHKSQRKSQPRSQVTTQVTTQKKIRIQTNILHSQSLTPNDTSQKRQPLYHQKCTPQPSIQELRRTQTYQHHRKQQYGKLGTWNHTGPNQPKRAGLMKRDQSCSGQEGERGNRESQVLIIRKHQ